MPKVLLTDRFARAARSDEAAQTDYFDTVTPGLSLRVGAGGARVWYLTYTRPATGKRARAKLGTFPEMQLARARKRAVEERSRVGEGEDPGQARALAREGMRLAELVDLYVERHATGLRSAAAIERRLRKNVADVIGDVKVADLHRRDVTRALDRIVDRGRPVEANRVFEDTRAMVRWAVGKGYLDTSPLAAMTRPARTTPRERVLTPDEIRELWQRLEDATMSDTTRSIIRLCLITAQRVGEVAGMQRRELDLRKCVWMLPGARTKNGQSHAVPLSGAAVVEITAMPGEGQAVFPGQDGETSITAHAIATAVRRSQEAIGISQWTAHDLRRTALTGMAELGIDPFTLGHVANHISTTKATVTTAVYARYSYEREKRAALDAWAARLASIISQEADIVPLRA